MRKLLVGFTSGAALLCCAQLASAGLVFNLADTGNTDANAGFQRAADYLSSHFSDNATINIDSGFSNLGGSILGSTSTVSNTYTYSAWKAAVLGDSKTTDDGTFSSNLPGGTSFNVYINGTSDNPNGSGSATPYNDDDGGANNTTVRISDANAKALGLTPGGGFGASDATITFNSTFAFDFDPSDGIDAGKIDFVGVAIHEIMHSMGFISGVDVLDYNSGAGPNAGAGPFSDNAFSFVSGLDFTRVSAAATSAGADIDWTADTRAKDFSIDGGTTALVSNAWSTGVSNGDGRQASHWKDGMGLGIMDPTSAPAGSANVVTALDLQALDVIGWDPFLNEVPEPSTLVLLLIGSMGIAGVSRRRRQTGEMAA